LNTHSSGSSGKTRTLFKSGILSHLIGRQKKARKDIFDESVQPIGIIIEL